MSDKKKTGSYLRGITRLITDATIGITDMVEAVHKQIVHPSFLPSTPVQHLITNIAGKTYQNVRTGTKVVGEGLDIVLDKLTPILRETPNTDKSEAIRAVLNGVIGDHLEERSNPLKIDMCFRHQSKTLPTDKKGLSEHYPTINGKILLMVHGLCMNDILWARKGHNHGTELAKVLSKTPIYLYYNTGRHISSNGRDFDNLLEELVTNWPVPVEELVIVAHSMGGLVTRSAIHYGLEQQKTWTKNLKEIAFLGTPHHGAPLERVGNYVDVTLESFPYAKPFARLGKIRSAGVTDLRYGNLLDEDWQGIGRFEAQNDQRKHIQLPKTVKSYCIAANIKKATGQTLGDGLVTVKSALGQHKNSSKNLDFKKENTWVAHETSHFDLLNHPKVYTKLKEWLT